MQEYLSRKDRQCDDEPVTDKVDGRWHETSHPVDDDCEHGRKSEGGRNAYRHHRQEVGAQTVQTRRSVTQEDTGEVVAHWGNSRQNHVIFTNKLALN